MKAECSAETSKPSYYPTCNKADDHNLKYYDAFCSGLIIILKSFFLNYCKESMYSMF